MQLLTDLTHCSGRENYPAVVSSVDRHRQQVASIVHGFLSRVVASIYEVDTTLLTAPSRGNAKVAFARQIAMYLAHVSCGLTLTEVGQQFGRDRTTVAHACEIIEEQREDAAFDQMIELLEKSVTVIWLTREVA
ncbi:MAG: helix-turn-helix domain-containing protein [Pseudomonadota bacterium]